jgi:hypothetical protein
MSRSTSPRRRPRTSSTVGPSWRARRRGYISSSRLASISSMIPSSRASAVGMEATTRPSRITVTRSEISSTSSSRWET